MRTVDDDADFCLGDVQEVDNERVTARSGGVPAAYPRMDHLLRIPERQTCGFAAGVAADHAATLFPAALVLNRVGGFAVPCPATSSGRIGPPQVVCFPSKRTIAEEEYAPTVLGDMTLTNFAFVAAQMVIPATIDGIADCFRTLQEEETKRQVIAANREVLITRITAEKDAILAYFDLRFAERRAALDEFFELLNHAMKSGDNQQLNTALAGILGVIQDNPLDDFETFRQQFNNPDHVIEI